ncbi:unnamed protein product, partial [Rotaria sordida]
MQSIAFAVPDSCHNERILAEEIINEAKRQVDLSNSVSLMISFVMLSDQEILYQQFRSVIQNIQTQDDGIGVLFCPISVPENKAIAKQKNVAFLQYTKPGYILLLHQTSIRADTVQPNETGGTNLGNTRIRILQTVAQRKQLYEMYVNNILSLNKGKIGDDEINVLNEKKQNIADETSKLSDDVKKNDAILPNQIWFECFKYLNAVHIFYALDQLNSRFNNLIRTLPLYEDFQDV